MSEPELMEVELLSGVKVNLPKEQALKEIEHRQKYKTDMRTAHEEVGKVRAEKEAAAQMAADSATKLEAEKAMKAGELEKAKQILEHSTNEKLGKIERSYRRARLEAAIVGNAGVVSEAARDIADALSHSCRFDLETESLSVVGADGKMRVGSDGKPLSVDALIAEYADARPYLRKSTAPAGSGAAGGAGKQPGKILLRSEWDRLDTKSKAAHFEAGGTLRDS